MKYYIIAGEASGDLHGSNLIRALRQADPDAEFRFWGGDRMAHEAGTPVRHINQLAYMGFVEVLGHLPTIMSNFRLCKQDLLSYRPDVCILIDYPGFNLKIARFTRQQHIPNLYYISPQVWAWKRGRLKTMRRTIDRLCYILPSERDFFAHADFPQAIYVGHPLIDEVERYRHEDTTPATATDTATSDDPRPLIALLPGSRRQELRNMLPPMLRLARRHPEYRFQVAGMSLIGTAFYDAMLRSHPTTDNLTIVYDDTYAILSQAYAAVVCSGTATLETALFRVPQVVCYKANPISIAIARRLVHLNYISLVNLTADAPIVKELIQNDFNDDIVEHEFLRITADATARQQMLAGYDHVINLLGGAGASARTAQAAIDVATSKPTTL